METIDKHFNLQLTIQKLEEELSLYRNGTTAGELLDLIKEKDIEIDNLRDAVVATENKVRKIAKTSGEVLTKCDGLEAVNFLQKKSIEEMTEQIQKHESSITELRDEMKHQETTNSISINKMTNAYHELENTNLTLLKTNELNKSEIIELKDKISLQFSIIDQLKAREEDLSVVKKTLSEKESVVKRLTESLNDCDNSIEKLQKRCADLVAEKAEKLKQLDQERQDMINHVQKFRDSMASNIAQRDETLKRKEDKVKELNFQINVLTQDAKLKAQRHEEILAEKNSFWSAKVVEMEARLRDVEGRASAVPVMDKLAAAMKMENDSLKARNIELEEKISRQEQYMKRKILKERSGNLPNETFEQTQMPEKGIRKTAAAESLPFTAANLNALGSSISSMKLSGNTDASNNGFTFYQDSRPLPSRMI